MRPEYFDIHSHVNFEHFDPDREELIQAMKDQNIWTATVGTNLETSREAVDLANRNDHFFAIIGLHPTEAHAGFDRADFKSLEKHSHIVGVGECGLDYYRLRGDSKKERAMQRKAFEDQITFALEYDKPLMLHCRPSQGSMDAYHDVIDIIESYQRAHGDTLRGNSHFFSGDRDVAHRFLDCGFTMSFSGPITFAPEYHDVIKYVPLDMMMADSDAPYAAPSPYRGKRNSPLYIKEIVRTVAEIRSENLDTVKKAFVDNAFRLFSL